MFGRKNNKNKAVSIGIIENIIGYVLQSRSEIINYGEIAQQNIYTGYAILSLFESDQKRLGDEFDCLLGGMIFSVLRKNGIPDKISNDALVRVFNNSDLPELERKHFLLRVGQHKNLSYGDLADLFVENLQVHDFPDRFKEGSRNVLSKQLKDINKELELFTNAELRKT